LKKSITLVFLLFSVAIIFAQPANDNCNAATTVTPNGTCYSGTTVAATDNWQGSVGCQGGGNHPDIWYTFTSTGSQVQFTITASAPWSGNIEVILVQGTCASGFNIIGSQCGSSPLNASFNGLISGTVYYYTISNANGGTPGPFQTCVTTSSPPTSAGQDCNNAAILCNSNTFSQPTSNAGFGSQEVTTANSCWGIGGERQSKWFKFTAGCNGTLEFNINPVNGNDDYDWALWNITADPNGCTTKGNSIACNWSGCTGSTGISTCSTSEPGFKNCGSATGGDPCGNGNFPRAWGNWSSPGGGASTCLSNTINLVAGNVYALLVDNFTASNSGFTLTFGGACGGGTATIGPNANFTYTTSGCGTYNFTKTCPTSNSTFLWQFGDGTTATTQNASHTYTTFGNFVITLQVTDALGCVTTYSQTINIVSTPLPVVTTPVTYCVGAIASPLTASGTNLLWYTIPTGGTGSFTAPTPSTATPGTTSYYVSQTIGGCESGRAQIDVVVNPSVTPTFNAVAPICSGGTLSPLPTTSLNGITGSWSPALNNTATTTYTFTPAAAQCATTASLTITVNQILSPTINCGVSTTSSVAFTWNAVSGSTGYNISYQINAGSPVNIGAIGNVLSYQVSGLAGGDNVTINVTPTGGAGSCFTSSSMTCTAISCVPPTANISYVSPFCSNNATPQLVSLTGTGVFTGGVYSALPGLALNSTTGSITPASSVPGTYTVTYTVASGGGCPGVIATTSVTIYSVTPSVSITSSTTSICTGGSVTFTATPTNGGVTPTYQWKVNGVNVAGQTASTFTTTTLNNGDIVTVTMSSSDPCANPIATTSNAITITTASVVPSVSITSSTTSICTGGSVTFTATPTNGGATPTYQWKVNGVNVAGQTASTFTTTTLNNGDIVTVTMSSSDPCANPTNAISNTVAVVVNIVPMLSITNPQTVCVPSTVDLTAPAVTSGSSAGSTYSYWINAACTTPLSNPNSVAVSGIYYIRGQSAGGCFTIKPVTVTIENNIPGIRYPGVTIAANTQLALQARSPQPNCTYQWSPNRGLNNYTNRDVVFSYDRKTEYLITITSPAGCVTIDTQLVIIETTQFGIFVPRAWTPNGDGHNDLLFPLTLNITKINYFRIFNRWGQLVFETNAPNTGWNGIYKGKQQPIDVYTWSVEAVTITGEIIRRSGNSVLIR
jgi:gliding motility-associated-like protein